MRSPQPETTRPIRDTLRRLIKAPAALSIIWPILLIVGGYVAWYRWGAEHVGRQYSYVDSSAIRITKSPDYVRSDIVDAVYRDTAMEGLSLLDPQATVKIASAFSMHPWVRTVTSVRKLSGGVVDVRLDYRRPVAMVQVFRSIGGSREKFFFPVDGNGVLLPTGEFTRAETSRFVHIDVPGADSSNAEGMPFGDPRVEAASRLAEVLSHREDHAGVKAITVSGDWRRAEVPQLELTTQSNTRHFWGSPPGMELPGEPTTDMKLQLLLSIDGHQSTDLRVARLPH